MDFMEPNLKMYKAEQRLKQTVNLVSTTLIYILGFRRCQLDYFVLQIEWHICCEFKGPSKETIKGLWIALKIPVCAINGPFREARLQSAD